MNKKEKKFYDDWYKAAMTFANIITISRFILIIPFLYFLYLKQPNFLSMSEFTAKLVALIIFVVASFTDYLDGMVARLWKEESKLGKFLDPLADKFLVASAFVAFVQLEGSLIPFWMVLLVIFREFIITALRITALSQTKEMETMTLGKAKTTSQLLTIIVILVFFVLKAYYYPSESDVTPISLDTFLIQYFDDFGNFIRYTPFTLMSITTVITVFSGIRYLVKNRVLFLGE